jgi:hypothetical protein
VRRCVACTRKPAPLPNTLTINLACVCAVAFLPLRLYTSSLSDQPRRLQLLTVAGVLSATVLYSSIDAKLQEVSAAMHSYTMSQRAHYAAAARWERRTTLHHVGLLPCFLQGLRQHYVLDSPDAGCFDEWRDSDTPGAAEIFTDFYVYHITNPWDMVTTGAKPNLTEVGPLRYRFKQRKLDVQWDPEDLGDVVSYVQQQYYLPADDATAALAATHVTSIW